MRLKLLSAVVASLCGLAAHAQTTHMAGEAPFALGIGPVLLVGSHSQDAPAPFVDGFAFTVDGTGTVSAAFLIPGLLNDQIPPALLPFLALPTYFGLIDSQGVELSADTDFSDGQLILANVPVVAGSYAFVVAGLANPPLGVYVASASAQVTAVPEPETYALMLAGLSLGVWLARRRQA